jgi:hypothetical protein
MPVTGSWTKQFGHDGRGAATGGRVGRQTRASNTGESAGEPPSAGNKLVGFVSIQRLERWPERPELWWVELPSTRSAPATHMRRRSPPI